MIHIKHLFFVPLLFIVLITSCGNDDSDKAIRYIESEVESYTVYVGSEEGGIELDLDSIKDRLDLIFPMSVFENFTNTTFSFIDENIVLIEQQGSKPEINNYIFEGNSLFLYKDKEPLYYGNGDISSFNIRQHYIAYKQAGDKTFINLQAIPQKEIGKDDIAKQSPFTSIQNMKSSEDTLIWCTRSSLFE